jgi:hypothetical protein
MGLSTNEIKSVIKEILVEESKTGWLAWRAEDDVVDKIGSYLEGLDAIELPVDNSDYDLLVKFVDAQSKLKEDVVSIRDWNKKTERMTKAFQKRHSNRVKFKVYVDKGEPVAFVEVDSRDSHKIDNFRGYGQSEFDIAYEKFFGDNLKEKTYKLIGTDDEGREDKIYTYVKAKTKRAALLKYWPEDHEAHRSGYYQAVETSPVKITKTKEDLLATIESAKKQLKELENIK